MAYASVRLNNIRALNMKRIEKGCPQSPKNKALIAKRKYHAQLESILDTVFGTKDK